VTIAVQRFDSIPLSGDIAAAIRAEAGRHGVRRPAP